MASGSANAGQHRRPRESEAQISVLRLMVATSCLAAALVLAVPQIGKLLATVPLTGARLAFPAEPVWPVAALGLGLVAGALLAPFASSALVVIRRPRSAPLAYRQALENRMRTASVTADGNAPVSKSDHANTMAMWLIGLATVLGLIVGVIAVAAYFWLGGIWPPLIAGVAFSAAAIALRLSHRYLPDPEDRS
jgi:hypothetical protein